MQNVEPVVAATFSFEGLQHKRILLLIRLVIVFALLVSTVFISFGNRSSDLIHILKYLYYGVAGYLIVILSRLLIKGKKASIAGGYVQILADASFVTLLVYLTGLYESFFSFLYIIVIILGSLEMYMAGGFAAGLVSSAFYTFLVFFQFYGNIKLPFREAAISVPFQELLTHIMANDFGFILSGILSGFLGNELKRSRIQVEKRETDIKVLEDFNRNIIENIASGIITTDEKGKTTFINRMALTILGIGQSEALGKQLVEIMPGLDMAPERSPDRGERDELEFRRKDGYQMFLGFSFSSLREHEGREVGKILIFQDLTMIKDMEERVKLADRLAMLGELASGLAHEIRNPLASIAGSAQILNEGDNVDIENRVLLEIIEKESNRLNNLIKDFLTFAKPDIRNIEKVDLFCLCEEVVRALSVSGASGEKVSFSLEVDEKPFVQGDPEKLKQVVWNLLLNAVQAVGQEGKVVVFVDLKSVQERRYGCVTVEDNGPGIDADCVDKVFVPFFTTKEGGTGLGLAVTSRIVQSHSGFIKVDRNKRDGARITVYLPEKIG